MSEPRASGDLVGLGDLPVLGISGFSGAGKTTLLLRLIPALRAEGLRVAVVKHDAHGLQVDRPGKDSDRLFRAGAQVLLQGPAESLLRLGPQADPLPWLRALAQSHDLVLVEGHKRSPFPKVWLASAGEAAPPPELSGLLAVLPWDSERLEPALRWCRERAARQWRERPLYGALLIGGESRRMGRPKHLLPSPSGATWVERSWALLRARCQRCFVVGAGLLPPSLAEAPRLPDVPEAQGPLAGLLAALRWAPRAAWLALACDLPEMSEAALDWLLEQRAPGRWAVLPRLPGSPGVEPLGACYEPHALPLLERLAAGGRFGLGPLATQDGVTCPEPPAALAGAWTNVNEPAALPPRAQE